MKFIRRYNRVLRKEHGQLANWPMGRSIELGDIGYYYSRKGIIDWKTNLNELGIEYKTEVFDKVKGTSDLIYKSSETITAKGNATGVDVKMSFNKKNAFSAKSHNVLTERILSFELEKAILNHISKGNFWDKKKWFVVTEIEVAEKHLLYGSTSRKGMLDLSITASDFEFDNSAIDFLNPKLSISVENKEGAVFKHQKEGKYTPYFIGHRIAKKGVSSLYLKQSTHRIFSI